MTREELHNTVLLVHKPAAITSSDTIGKVKKILRARKIGHAGTLDMFATGLLVVCTGALTKLTRFFLESDKQYAGRVRLGIRTDTDDIQGNVIDTRPVGRISDSIISGMTARFTGPLLQSPPAFSALKVGGRRASDLARKGMAVDLAPRPIEIRKLEVRRVPGDESALDITVGCSKGTYIRSLARDMGDYLGTGAHLESLVRTASGNFLLDDAVSPDELSEIVAGRSAGKRFFRSAAEALSGFGTVRVNERGEKKALNGAIFPIGDVLEMKEGYNKPYIVFGGGENLIAIAEIDIEDWNIRYLNVFSGE